jgi:formylglycine-generating enzyme required for sulfatase activity
VNGLGATFRLIPAGRFLMGSPESDPDAYSDEKPQHTVMISRSYYMGETEVTQGQWKAVLGTEPWKGKDNVREGANYPATNLSWEDAVEYCRRLSELEGRTYRLPTEAEWEYACRGVTKTRYSFGDDAGDLSKYGWFEDNASDKGESYAHEVKQKLANPYGLYDIHGNVWEWCSDWYGDYSVGALTDPLGAAGGSYRVSRGGCWDFQASSCRAALRGGSEPSYRDSYLGFRLLLSPSVE